MMDPRKDAIFSVLNDWLDLPQNIFEKMWDELDAATEVPRGKARPKLDPEPWVDYGGERSVLEPAWEGGDWDPRPGYSKDKKDYGYDE